DAVLDVLVSDHVLVRAGDTPGYSFQHHQFQEWYASHTVGRRIVAAATDPAECVALKTEILDLPAWEEPILFAVERLARGDTHQIQQISMAALRNCRRFRPSILGEDAEDKITALPPKVRTLLLSEIASRSGMDGLDLATAIARDDPDPGVQASVVDALAFRRA